MKKKYLRYLIYFSEVCFFYSLEQVFFQRFANIVCLLIMPCFISILVLEKKSTSVIFGAFSGILIDISFGGLIGVSAIFLSILSFLISDWFIKFIKPNFLISSIISLCGSLILIFYNFLINKFIRGYNIKFDFFQNQWKTLFTTFLMSILIYLLNRSILHITRENKNDNAKF